MYPVLFLVLTAIAPVLADPETPEIPPPVPTERVHGRNEMGTRIRVPPTYTEGSKNVWIGSEMKPRDMKRVLFKTTNSPCRDAVLANMNFHGCSGLKTVLDTQDIFDTFEYTCNTPSSRSDVQWTTWTFVEIDRPLIEMGKVVPPAPVPLCVDVWIYLYAIKPVEQNGTGVESGHAEKRPQEQATPAPPRQPGRTQHPVQ